MIVREGYEPQLAEHLEDLDACRVQDGVGQVALDHGKLKYSEVKP